MPARCHHGGLKIVIFAIILGAALLSLPVVTSPQALGQSDAPTPTKTPWPYVCETGTGFDVFDADYAGVIEVCPANPENHDGVMKTDRLYIVIHNTDNQSATAILGNIRAFQKHYDDPKQRRSAHYIVGLNEQGEVQVIQLVKESEIAYHAGNVSQLNGQRVDNSNSIGIEVVGSGTLNGWPADAVYQTVADLVADIIRRHKVLGQKIELDRNFIVGHEEISTTGKPDPGPHWDWQRFMETELESDYLPAVHMIADRDVDSNEITLSVEARKSTRTHFQVEVSEDGEDFKPLAEISKNGDGKIANKAEYLKDSPQTYKLASYTPPTLEHPVKLCYRVQTFRDSYVYANPSSVDCEIVGQTGYPYDLLDRNAVVVSQSAFPIIKPGQDVTLIFKMRNTGILTWTPGGEYVLINTGGESFGMETQVAVPQKIWTNQEVEFHLPFKAPQKVGAYTTRWQMAYIDPHSGVKLFGKETGGVITVVPQGNTGSLEQIIQGIIDNVVQVANQKIEDYLADLQRRIQIELERQFRNWLITMCPPLAPILTLVIGGKMMIRRNKRRGDDEHG